MKTIYVILCAIAFFGFKDAYNVENLYEIQLIDEYPRSENHLRKFVLIQINSINDHAHYACYMLHQTEPCKTALHIVTNHVPVDYRIAKAMFPQLEFKDYVETCENRFTFF